MALFDEPFNWKFLIWLVAFGIIAVFFLFYFNRVLASIVSSLINAYSWYFYRVSIDIQALQVSLLGGRIFFKGIRYHGENETILVYDGFITWRYWFRRVRQANATIDAQQQRRRESASSHAVSTESPASDDENADIPVEKPDHGDLPCRILLEARGVEWFVYNRKPAYDSVLATLLKPSKPQTASSDGTTSGGDLYSEKPRQTDAEFEDGAGKDETDGLPRAAPTISHARSEAPTAERAVEKRLPAFLNLLPIGVAVNHAAMVMGNEHTRSVLVAKVSEIDGVIDARTSGPQDQYRQCFDFETVNASVQFKPNHDYSEPQLQRGTRLKKETQEDPQTQNNQFWIMTCLYNFVLRAHSLRKANPFHSKSNASLADPKPNLHGPGSSPLPHVDTSQSRWLGLSRYLKDDSDGRVEQERWKAIEYGRFETIFECPKLCMSFFWDVPGSVSTLSSNEATLSPGLENNINRDQPPAYGLKLDINGGTVNYGPWADRQRANLQSIFFPASYATIDPAEVLHPGQSRVATNFKIVITLKEQITLRVHTREESKDWRWKDRLEQTEQPASKQKQKGKKDEGPAVDLEIRPAGWIDVVIGSDTAVTYNMDMVPGPDGYNNNLQMELKPTQMSSSVNHDLMWRCKGAALSCHLPNPLSWSTLRKWCFDVMIDEFELFIIRDHAFLLTDLINDWTSGPPSDFFTFVPFLYSINLTLPNFKLYLNVNDSNIINSAASLEDNAFIVLWADSLNAAIGIPLKEYRPLKNKVTFDVDVSPGGLRLITPLWNTQRAFLESDVMGSFNGIEVRGSYNVCTSTSPTLTDTVLLDVHGDAPSIYLYGFLIRYFMNFKDNYFGDDLHFQTQEEYQQQLARNGEPNTTGRDSKGPAKITNDLDVILTISATDSIIIAPANLYSAADNIKIDIASFASDLRFTNYYMDLQVDFSPLALTRGYIKVGEVENISGDSNTQAFIDGVSVSGHRLFGLPPVEPTYVCNWDFIVGRLYGECSLDFVTNLVGAARSFAFASVDAENALPKTNPPILHDITFLRAHVEPIKLWLHVDSSVFLVATDEIAVNFNDWAGKRFSERIHISVPSVVLACLDGQAASRQHNTPGGRVSTYGYLRSSCDVRVVETKAEFEHERRLQQDWVALHDSRTNRTPWLLHTDDRTGPSLSHIKARPPASPFPPMPAPLQRDETQSSKSSMTQSTSSRRSQRKNRKSGFLSRNEASSHRIPQPHEARTQSHQNHGREGSESPSTQSTLRPGHMKSKINTNSSTRSGSKSTSMAFSSAFEIPYFALQFIEPDTRDVPLIQSDPSFDDGEDRDSAEAFIPAKDDTVGHIAVIVRVEEGIQGLFTPEAMFNVNKLISSLEYCKPQNILDQLQTTAISQTLSKHKPPGPAKMVELRATVPAVAIRLHSQASEDRASSERRVYDLGSHGLIATARHRIPGGGERKSDPGQSALHVALSRAAFTATSTNTSSPDDQARIDVALDTTVLWLVRSETLKGELQLGGLQLVNSNRKIHQLASLVNSTLALGDSLAHSFQNTALVQENRVRSFIYHLATSSLSLPDPHFLTSTSYAFRTTSFHPRNSDSWKLMSRLRHISKNTPLQSQLDILRECSTTDKQHPSNARDQVLSSFSRWRSWDLSNPDTSSLIRAIFGRRPDGLNKPLPLPNTPISFSLLATSLQIIIGPGSKQNEFSIENIITAVRSNTSSYSGWGEQSRLLQSWAVELSIGKTALHLNWGICEILESILKQYLAAPALTAPIPSDEPDKKDEIIMPWTLHLAAAVEQVSASFETINFRAFSECMELASSVVVNHNSAQDLFVSALINCAELVSGISSLHQPIINCKLIAPSLHGGLETKAELNFDRHIWRVGGLCQKLEADIREDALGLLGVADLFIRDEMAYVKYIDQEILGKLKDLPKSSQPTQKTSTIENLIHVSLLLQSFTISTKFLASLTYKMQGRTARSTIRSLENSPTKFGIDFDLLGHRHSFTNHANDTAHEVFKIALPSTNGQLKLTTSDDKLKIVSSVALEKIQINASEIYALFTTLSRNEITAFKENIKRDLALVQSNWQATSWSGVKVSEANTVKNGKTLMFHSRFSSAGLNIKASTSKSSKLPASLSLDIGKVHADLSNESSKHGLLPYAEISAGLQHVIIQLERFDGQDSYPCGDLDFTVSFIGTAKNNDKGQLTRSFEIKTNDFEINLYPETASSVVDIIGYLQQRFKSFNFTEEINTFRARRLRSKSHATPHLGLQSHVDDTSETPASLFSSMYALDINSIQLSWNVSKMTPISPGHEIEDLVFSIVKVGLATTKANSARLELQEMQLQLVPRSQSKRTRTSNSALLPEVVFNVAYLSTAKDRRLAFQAVGKSLDIRLTSQFILPASDVQKSIAIATEELRKVIADWNATFVREEQESKTILGNKALSSVLVDVYFAGAEVHIQGAKRNDPSSITSKLLAPNNHTGISNNQAAQGDQERSVVLSAPGVAFKVEYKNVVVEDQSLNAEIRVNASTNTLHPKVVLLILEISDSVKAVVGDQNKQHSPDNAHPSPTKSGRSEPIGATNPAAILGNCKLNIGLRICRQEFGLTCQPIARVAAAAKFEDIYITVNTVETSDQHRFFALSAVVTSLGTSVQHAYSRDKTGSFSLKSINLSLMNSRHVSGTEGLSAILKISPMKVHVNAKQLHDFFLFQEIWMPADLRNTSGSPTTPDMTSSQLFDVQRYQQMAATGAFPWNASIAIESLDIDVHLGQSLGKASFSIADFWISSKKSSDYQQNLCLGLGKVAINSTGRMSGFVELRAFRLQTSIHWPINATHETPLIEASIGFDDLRVKAAFEYQMFLIADMSSLEFLMYNVRQAGANTPDRLVCIVNGDQVHMYCTTQTASQTLGLYQAIQRLIQEKRTAYEQSLKEVAGFNRKRSTTGTTTSSAPKINEPSRQDNNEDKTPIKLQTNVVVSLKAVKVGAYPSTFFDSQIFKLEALDASAKFAVAFENGQVQSGLGLELGQVRIALSSNSAKIERKTLEDLSIEEIVKYATGSRGGTVLKVPRVVATMQTYQAPEATQIDYIFKSSFEGKVEVGWNYSRISYIRGMWEKHSRTLAQRLGKPLPKSAVQITGGPRPENSDTKDPKAKEGEQEKITAVVNVPLSKYSYTALEPPVIVTPQLRDMGEATPPLEWIGLNREKLPNITHQILIVPLLEVAKEVEDAYSKILGSS